MRIDLLIVTAVRFLSELSQRPARRRDERVFYFQKKIYVEKKILSYYLFWNNVLCKHNRERMLCASYLDEEPSELVLSARMASINDGVSLDPLSIPAEVAAAAVPASRLRVVGGASRVVAAVTATGTGSHRYAGGHGGERPAAGGPAWDKLRAASPLSASAARGAFNKLVKQLCSTQTGCTAGSSTSATGHCELSALRLYDATSSMCSAATVAASARCFREVIEALGLTPLISTTQPRGILPVVYPCVEDIHDRRRRLLALCFMAHVPERVRGDLHPLLQQYVGKIAV